MAQKPVKDENPGHQANDRPQNESLPRRKRKFLRPRYFVNETFPLVLIFVAAILGGGMMPSGRTYRIYCFWGFLSCVVTAGFMWIAHSEANKHVPTEEELDEEFRSGTTQALNQLDSRVNAIDERTARRRLTPEQIAAITNYLRAGNFTSVYGIAIARFSGDAHDYATDFHNMLTDAGWTQVQPPAFMSSRNFEIRVNPLPKDGTPALRALFQILLKEKVVTMDTPLIDDANVPEGEIIIWIGLHP